MKIKGKIPFVGMAFEKIRLRGNQVIAKGVVIPNNHYGVIEDLNFIKSGNTKPSLDLYIMDSKLRRLPSPILKDITSSTNGVGEIRLESGECLGLVLHKQDGRCKLSGYVSGYLKTLEEKSR